MSDTSDKIFIAIFIVVVVTCLMIVFKLKAFTLGNSLFVVMGIFVMIIFAIIMDFLKNKEIKDDYGKTNKIKEMIDLVNFQLEQFPEYDRIKWEGGVNVRAEFREFLNTKNESVEYFCVVGKMEDSSNYSAVFVDVEKKGIVKYIGDLKSNEINDAFKFFKPFDSTARYQNNMTYGDKGIYGRKNQSSISRRDNYNFKHNINFQDYDGMNDNYPPPVYPSNQPPQQPTNNQQIIQNIKKRRK